MSYSTAKLDIKLVLDDDVFKIGGELKDSDEGWISLLEKTTKDLICDVSEVEAMQHQLSEESTQMQHEVLFEALSAITDMVISHQLMTDELRETLVGIAQQVDKIMEEE